MWKGRRVDLCLRTWRLRTLLASLKKLLWHSGGSFREIFELGTLSCLEVNTCRVRPAMMD